MTLSCQEFCQPTFSTLPETVEQPSLVSVKGTLSDGRVVSVSGTYVPAGRATERLTELDGFPLELDANRILVFFRYSDRPGVVGAIGSLLGEAGVNIAAMQVARREAGGEALMTLTVDHKVEPVLLAEAAEAIGATAASVVDLND